MTVYNFPDLSIYNILYKGKRYIAFEIGITNIFNEFDQELDFIVWDGLYDAPIAHGIVEEDGTYKGVYVFGDQELEIEATTIIAEFVEEVVKAQSRFTKDSE